MACHVRCTRPTRGNGTDAMKALAAAAIVVSMAAPGAAAAQEAHAVAGARITVRRLAQNPLITVRSSPSLGGNVNGATVIRVPDWIAHPLGRYYMYFANHMGDFIRLAYAD